MFNSIVETTSCSWEAKEFGGGSVSFHSSQGNNQSKYRPGVPGAGTRVSFCLCSHACSSVSLSPTPCTNPFFLQHNRQSEEQPTLKNWVQSQNQRRSTWSIHKYRSLGKYQIQVGGQGSMHHWNFWCHRQHMNSWTSKIGNGTALHWKPGMSANHICRKINSLRVDAEEMRMRRTIYWYSNWQVYWLTF